MKGKAQGRYFFHDGTAYGLTGNQQLAMSHFHELRAHLHQLKRVNVNNLPIVFGTKEFDDGTVARFQLIHGIEKVMVYAPGHHRVEPTTETKRRVETDERFVPVIRSADNKWWVACMSGTFEGPYYAFENRTDLPVEAFADNVETEINNIYLATGGSDLEGKGIPELFFIAQTGILPDNSDIDEEETEYINDTQTYVDTKVEHYACPWSVDEFKGETRVSFERTTTPYSYVYSITVYGADIGVPSFKQWTTSHDGSGYAQFGRTPPLGGWDTAAEAIADAEDYYSGGTYTIVYGLANTDHYVEISGWSFSELFAGNSSIRIEPDNTDNVCSAYRTGESNYVGTHGHEEVSRCAGARGVLYSEGTEASVYKDYWKVDGREFLLNEQADTYPIYDHGANCMKYYNTNSRAKITAIMSIYARNTGPVYDYYRYYYLGPNSGNELSTTEFVPGTGEFFHTIPNMEVDGEPLKFYGEIFLGLVKWPEKVTETTTEE